MGKNMAKQTLPAKIEFFKPETPTYTIVALIQNATTSIDNVKTILIQSVL